MVDFLIHCSYMFTSVLTEAGLSDEEAKVYETLLTLGTRPVAEIYARVRPLKRTTLYQVLRRLVERGVVRESEMGGKTVFSPEPPEALLAAVDAEARRVERQRAMLAEAMPKLRETYLLAGERPVLRFHDGPEGIKAIYEEHLASGVKELRFVRTGRAKLNSDAFGNWWAHYIRRRREKKVTSFAITADDADANHDPARDAFLGVVRTWVRPQDYDAPVELDIYGDTVAIISFGKEMFGVTMRNAHIAKAFLDLFELARRGAETIEVPHDHS
jgi:HTH-type transcriptional regulator, sugar sensing transcriptional regulator